MVHELFYVYLKFINIVPNCSLLTFVTDLKFYWTYLDKTKKYLPHNLILPFELVKIYIFKY